MFDYVMTLAAVIIGLAITHLMQGLARLLHEPGKVKIWWVHLVWVAYMLLTSVFWWWFEYVLRGVELWTFAKYLFVLSDAFITYMIAAVLFPGGSSGFASYEDYFLARRGWFFGLQIIALALDPIDSALKGLTHLESLGAEYWIAIIVSIVLAIIGILSARKRVQGAIAVLFLVYQISWIARMFATVQ